MRTRAKMTQNAKKKRILLVDDDPSLQATLSDFLSFEGYEVQCCSSGEEALLCMRPWNPDLVILDMGMPGMGGTGFLESILKEDGSTLYPVLVLTARASMAAYFADKQVAGFVAKPADPNDLLQEIGRIMFEYPSTPEDIRARAIAGNAMVVDPDPAFGSALAIELARIGFAPDRAATGREALEQAVRSRPAAVAIAAGLQPPIDAAALAAALRALPETEAAQIAVYGTAELPADAQAVAAALAGGK